MQKLQKMLTGLEHRMLNWITPKRLAIVTTIIYVIALFLFQSKVSHDYSFFVFSVFTWSFLSIIFTKVFHGNKFISHCISMFVLLVTMHCLTGAIELSALDEAVIGRVLTWQGGMNPIKAVIVSFYYSLDYCVNEWTGWPVFLLVIVLIPLFWRLFEKTVFTFRYPLMVVLFGYGFLSLMLVPSLITVGNVEAAGLQAIVFAVYILVLTLCEGYVIGYIRRWLSGQTPEKGLEAVDSQYFTINEIWCILGCILFFVVAWVLTAMLDAF